MVLMGTKIPNIIVCRCYQCLMITSCDYIIYVDQPRISIQINFALLKHGRAKMWYISLKSDSLDKYKEEITN